VDEDSGNKVGTLAELRLYFTVVKLSSFFEDDGIRVKDGEGARFGFKEVAVDFGDDLFGFRLTYLLDWVIRFADFVALGIVLVVAFDDDLEKAGESVDCRGTNAMEASRGLICRLGEFTAGMEFGHGQLESGNTRFMFVNGNAGTIVRDGNLAIEMEVDSDIVGSVGDGLIKGVIGDFGEEVVKTFFVGGADIHPGTFANRLETLEDGDIFSCVLCIRHRLYDLEKSAGLSARSSEL